MRVVLTIAEQVSATLVFAVVELWIIVSHPKTYFQSWTRARAQRRFPFHAFPRSIDEKFTWRKIFDHDPAFTRLSDKLVLRDWIKETGVGLEMTPVLWSGFSPRAMPKALQRGDVMIKANHDSGSNWPMWNNPPEPDVLLREMEHALASDFSRRWGEWGYKQVAPRIFAEARIGSDEDVVSDLKLYTFGRRIERIVHIEDRADGRHGQIFVPDETGEYLRLERPPSVCDFVLDVPIEGFLADAVDLARTLGEPFDHMRVDFMEAGGQLYLSEMTIYNQSGHLPNGGEDPNSQVSRAWDINRSWVIRTRSGGALQRLYLGLLKRAVDRAGATKGLPPA